MTKLDIMNRTLANMIAEKQPPAPDPDRLTRAEVEAINEIFAELRRLGADTRKRIRKEAVSDIPARKR